MIREFQLGLQESIAHACVISLLVPELTTKRKEFNVIVSVPPTKSFQIIVSPTTCSLASAVLRTMRKTKLEILLIASILHPNLSIVMRVPDKCKLLTQTAWCLERDISVVKLGTGVTWFITPTVSKENRYYRRM